MWLCKCSCGNTTVAEGGNLRSGHTTSCGHCEKYDYLNPETMICILPNKDTFIFDTSDFDFISQHKWSIENSGYVHTTIKGEHIRLHKYLLGYDGFIDHQNGDRSDNRRSNLRICTNAENVRNQRLSVRNTSGYKGVCFDKRREKFEASITVNFKKKFLGYYDSPVEAAHAYDRAAFLLHGEFARPNFGKGGIYGEILELETA